MLTISLKTRYVSSQAGHINDLNSLKQVVAILVESCHITYLTSLHYLKMSLGPFRLSYAQSGHKTSIIINKEDKN